VPEAAVDVPIVLVPDLSFELGADRAEQRDYTEFDESLIIDRSGDPGWDGYVLFAGYGDLSGAAALALISDECDSMCRLLVSGLEVVTTASFICGFNHTRYDDYTTSSDNDYIQPCGGVRNGGSESSESGP
jgi:hypothetical protein